MHDHKKISNEKIILGCPPWRGYHTDPDQFMMAES